MNRRKLGSNRRKEGRQNVKEPEPERDPEPRNDVQEETRRFKPQETRVSAATQLEIQEESGHEKHSSLSAKHDPAFVSTMTCQYSEVKTSSVMPCSEDAFKTAVGKDDNMQTFKETKLEVPEAYDSAQREGIKENMHRLLPEWYSLNISTLSSLEHEIIKQEDPCTFSVAERKSKKKYDEGLSVQDESLQGNYPVRESHVRTLVSEYFMPEITTDKSIITVNSESENSIEQTVVLLPSRELSTNEYAEELFKLPKVRDGVLTEETLKKMGKKDKKPTQMQHLHQNTAQSTVLHATEDYSAPKNIESEINTHRFQLVVKVTDEQNPWATKENNVDEINESDPKQIRKSQLVPSVSLFEGGEFVEEDKHGAEQRIHQKTDFSEGEKNDNSPLLDLNAPDSPLQDKSSSTDEQNKSNLKFGGARLKLVSSQRNKGRQHVKDDMMGDEAFETSKVSFKIKTEDLKNLSETELSVLRSVSNGNSISLKNWPAHYSEVQTFEPTKNPTTEPQSLILTDEERPRSHDKKWPNTKEKVEDLVDITQKEGVAESLPCENAKDVRSAELQRAEVYASQTQEHDSSSETVKGYATQNCEIFSGNLTGRVEMTEPTIKSTDDSDTKLDENIVEAVVQKSKNMDVQYTNQSKISDVDMANSGQVHDLKDRVEDVQEPNTQLIFSKKKGVHFYSEKDSVNVQSEMVDEKVYIGALTKLKEPQQLDYASGTVMDDAQYYVEIVGNVDSQSKISDMMQSKVAEKSDDETVTKEKVLPRAGTIIFAAENVDLEVVGHRNKDDSANVSQQTMIHRIGEETMNYKSRTFVERDVTQNAGKAIFSEDDSKVSVMSPLPHLNAPPDLQLENKSLSTDKKADANFSLSGNRRKLGSSHKKKRRKSSKESKEEYLESTYEDKELETSQLFKIQTAEQEDSSQGNEHKVVLLTSQDSSMSLMFESQRIFPENENFEHDQENRKLDIGTSMITRDVISETTQREVQEVKVHPKQMRESLQTGYPESLTGHAEMSMLPVKSGDASGVKEVDYPTTGNILDNSDLKPDDYDLSDTEKQPIRDTVDSSLSQVYEFKVRVEDEVKPNTEQMFHQEKERPFSETEDKSASTLQSETFSSESQPQKDSETKDEQTSRAFSSSDRRKLGSSRRNKRGQRVKESTGEVLENTKADESIDTTLVSLKEKPVIQEKLTHELQSDVNVFLPHESSMFTVLVSSSEVHSSGTKDNPDTHLESFITKTVNPPVHPDQKDKNIYVKTFDKSGEAKPIKSDSPVTKEVISLHGPIIVAEQKQRPETLQTQEQESLQIDQTHDTKTNDVLENPQTVSDNLVDHSEIIKTHPSEFTQRSDNESITKQEMLTQEDTALMSSTTEMSLNAAVQINEDIPVVGPKQIWITRTGVETALSLHEDEELVDKDKKLRAGQSVHQEGDLSEAQWKDVSVLSPLSSLNAPSDLQLQDKPPSTDEQTDANFSFSGHRRKLGSSHKKKRRKSSKESKEEYLESTNEDKELETSQLLKIQTAEQEDSSQGNEHKVVLSTSQDSSMSLMSESQRIFPENEHFEHDQENRKLDIGTSMITSDVISETTQREVQEVKVHPKQIEESLQTGYPESLTGHAEMSMFTMKSGDASGVKEVDYPTTGNILDDSDLKLDDYDLSDTEKQPIRDTVDSSLSQVYEFKVRVEDEVKPNSEQMFPQDKERLFSETEDKSASTLQSETFSSESQPQKDSETKDELTSRAFSSSDRRKLGSSRRNKRGQRVKESTDEVLENTKADESIDTTLVSLKEKPVIQEKLTHALQSDVNVFLPHESSMFTVLVSSSEVHSSGTKDNPDTHLESFITKTVNPPVHPDQKDKNIYVKTFDKSGEAKPLNKSDSPVTKEVISLHGPIIVAEQKQRPETLQTQEQESLQIDHTHDTKTNDVLENPQTVSGNLVDHSEIIKTRPSEFTQRSDNDSITKQEMLTQEDTALMSSTTEMSLNAAVQINEDIPVVGPKQIWITRTGVETALSLHEDEELVDKDKKHRAGQSVHQEGDLSEAQWKDVSVLSPLSSLSAPSDIQLQDKPPSTDEQTDANFSFSGHRRKLGSSRKNKGKQHGKGPKEEDSENSKDEELETSQLFKIPTAGQEDLSQGNEHNVVLSTSQDSSMSLMFESQRIIPEKLQHDKDKRKPDIKTKKMEETVDLTQQGVDQIQSFDKEKTSDVISETTQREVQEVKVHPKQKKESLQTGYPESLTGHAEMSMLTMKSGDASGVKEVDYPTTRNILDNSDLKPDDYDLSDTEKQPIRDTVDSSLSQVYEFKVRVEDEVKPNTEQMFHQEKERLFTETEDKSASTLQSETFSSESQPQKDSETKDEQTSRAFSSSDRRKLGSSRRNKRGQRVKESTGEVLENTKADESIDTTLVSLKEKPVIQEKLTHELQSDVNVFLPHESSMFTVLVSSSEVHSSGTKDNPDTHLESFITKTVNPPVHPDQKDKNIYVKTFDKSGEAKPLIKSDSPVTKEVISLHGPIIVAEQKQRPETLQTQEQESLQIDQTHDTKTNDVLENPQTVSDNLVDHSEIIKTHPSEFTQRSHNESITKQEMLTQENTALMSSTTEMSLNAAVQINEDIPVVGPKQIWITRTGVETALSLHEDEELVDKDKKLRAGQSVHQEGDLSEAQWKDVSVLSPLSSLNAPSDLQLQDKPPSTDEQTDANFSFSGHRRKLGSSHKKMRRKSSKESKEEYLESTNEDKELETSQLLKIQTAEQEDSSQGNEHKVVLSTSQDSSMSLMSESQRIFPENEHFEHDQENRKLDIGTSMITSDVISETTQREVQEVKVHPKQIEESLQTGYPESLTGHAEMSMFTMKSGDYSGVKEVDYPTTGNILDDSDLKLDYYDLSDTEKQPIRDTVDSSLSQVYEFKVRVEDEVKPNSEQMFPQDKERLFSETEDKSASTLQSETFSSESQPQKDSETKEEQTSRAFSSSDRRKLGSSRRNKREQRVKEFTDEVLENTKADESIDTTLVSLKEKTVIQEKLTHALQSDVNVFLPHESSMFTVLVSSSEVHSSGTKDNPDTHLESFITKTVNPPVHPDQKDKNIYVKTFDKSGEAKPLIKSDSPVTKEVISLHGPIIVAEQKQRPETLQTQEQESLQIDQTHDTKTNDVLENPQTVSGNLVDHSEIIKTRQSEFTQRSDNDSITKQEMLTQEDKVLMSSTTEMSLNAAVQINDDIPVVGPKQIWITRTGVETALSLHEDEELVDKDKKHRAGQSVHQEGDLSEAQWKDVSVLSPLSSLSAPSDIQLQDKPPSTDEQTDANFSFSGHRRKLGSSRKNKGKQHGKGPKEEDSENSKDEELETSQLFKIPIAGQEDLSQGNEHNVVLSTSQDSSMSLMFESQRIIPEKLHYDKDKRKPDIKTKKMEEPVNLTQQGVDQIQSFDKEKTSDVISETTQREVQEAKVHPKQKKESLQTGYPESLTGHAEMSMLTMKSGDYSGVKEVDYPTTRNILDNSDLKPDDYDLSDTENQPIRDTVDSSLSQVYEFKVRVEDEVKPNTEQMFHQEKERLFTETEDKSASTLQSETFSSESQPQKDSETKDEQTSRAFSSSDRRKLGSSHRNKREQRVKEFTDEVLENTKADESIDTTLVSLKEKTVIQEKLTHELQSDVNVFLPHESSMFTVLVSSSEVHSSGTKDNPDTHLESFITKTVNPPVHPDQKDKNIDVKTFDKSGEAKPLIKSDSPVTKEVISLHGPIIVAEQKQRPETLQTQEQESLQIDQTHDTKTNDVLENPQTVSGNLVDHSEIIKTHPSEFTQRSDNESITKQEMLTQEDTALMSSTTEMSLNAAVQINEDIPVVGPKQIWITRTGVETALSLHEDEELVDKDKKHRAGQSVHQEGDLSEAQWKDVSVLSPLSSLNAPSDFQLQDKPPSTDEQTDANFSFSGHRRKLGSSRKNKGKQHGKGPKEEDSEIFKDEELETSQLFKIPTAGQEDLSQGNEHKVVLSTSQDSSMSLMFESQRIIPEKLQHDKDKRKPDIKTKKMEETVDLTQKGVDQIQTFDKEKTSDVISETTQREVQEVKVHPKQKKESLQTGYPESLTGHAEMSMLTMKSGDASGVKEVDYPTTRNILDNSDLKPDDYDLSDTEKQPIRDTVDSSLSQVYEFKVRVEDEVKPNTEQMFHQEKERLFTETEDKSASTLQSETFSSESQPQKDSETKDEQTSRAFSSSDRRKLGSSRRNKRGQRVKESTDEVLENTKADEILEKSKVGLETVTFEQKYSHRDTDHIFMTSVSQNRSVSLMPLSGHSSQVLSSDPPDYLETIPQSLPDSEKDSEDHSNRESSVFPNLVKESTNFSQQEVDKYLTASTRDLLGDDQNVNVHSTQESLHTCYSSVSGDTENLDIFSGNLSEQAEMFGLTKKSESASTDELYPTKVRMSVTSDLKPGTENPHAGDSALSQVHQPGSVRDPTTSGHKRKLTSSRRLKGGHTVKDPDAETDDKPVQESVEEASSFRLIETSDITPRRAHSSSNVDQKVPNRSMIQDGDLSSGFSITESRKRDDRTELPTKDKKLHDNVLASKPHSFPFTTDVDSEVNTSRDRTISENIAENKSPKNDAYESPQHAIDAVREAQVQEVDPGQVCAEKEEGEAVGTNEKTAQKSFYLTENKEMFDFLSSGRDFSVTSEVTTEKSIPRNHNEIECSVEQKAYSSPQDHLPTAGEQDKSINVSEAARKHQLEDIVSKEHTEQINPDLMQETCHIDSPSLVQNTSFVQTRQSDATVAVDFHCADHDQSNKNETHSDLKAAGGRRKLGSSRRIKGRQQAKFSETNQENKEDKEITDEATQMSATKTSREDFKSVEKVTTIVAEAEQTEKLPTTLGGSSVSTPEINSSSDKDDFTKSNKNTDEKHIELLHGTDSFCLITHCGLEKEGLMQSQGFVSEDDSDLQSSLKHDEIISILSGSESVFDQDQTIQRQNREARTLRQGVELQQMLKDTQTARGFSSEDHDRNSSVDAQEPRLDEQRENVLRAERGLSTSLEFISPSEESAMDLAYKKATSLKMDASEGLQETSIFKKRKIGSSRRTKISRKQEGETPSMDEPKDDDISTQDDVWNLQKVEVMVELPLIEEVKESLNVHKLHGARENDEAKTAGYDKHQQAVPEQRSKSTSEGVQSQTLEEKSSSPDFSSTSRRKMGSTCKNLGSQTQREILHQEEEPKIEAAESETAAGGAASERILQIKGVQLHSENKDSDQRTDRAFQPVEITHVEESLLKPPAEETPDESPVSLSQVDETKQTLHISPSSSPQNDAVLKSVRRKKFGSNRRSHLQQRNKNQDEKEDGVIQIHNEDHTRAIVEETADQNRDESPDLDKISEVHEKSSSNLPETKELSESVSEKTPGRSYHDEICFSQDSKRQYSLGNLGGANASDSYNVVLIGDSCVGKTSFMKRAQSGKFSLDIPASVGVDSCMWTVVVDGKPVMLQLWDTAGQERFHSITRQVFHRAQAFLLMYDITCSQSFSALSYWVNCIQEAAAEDVSVLLLGNKSDDEQRQVKTEEGDSLAKEYNFAFMECSAATGQNVIESLETMARMLSQSADFREKTTQLHKQPAQKKQSSCC